MTDNKEMLFPFPCPRSCPCPTLLDLAAAITQTGESVACLLNAECAKINKVVAAYSDAETLIAIDTSVQATLDRIITLEGILKAKLDSLIPLITDCM